MSYQANYQPVFYSSPSPYPGRPESYGLHVPSSSYKSSTSANDASPTSPISSSSLPPSEARHNAGSHGSALSIILFTLAIFVAVLGPATVLLALIFVLNTFERDGLGLRTSADLQNLLTISQLVTTVVSKSVPIVIAVHAYQLAAQWLKSSDRRTGGRPSPLQFGLLVSVLQGSNIIAWLKVRWHLLRGLKGSKRQVIKPSPILTRAVTVLGLLLIVSNVVAGFDTWLHLSSKVVTITQTRSYSSSTTPMYGRQLNETQCEEYDPFDSTSGPTCGMEGSAPDAFALSMPEGTQTLTNTSAKNMVVLTEDGTQSIIVPPSIEADVAYEATTFGVGSTCMSLTSDCLKPVVYDTYTAFGDNFWPFIDCTGVYPLANITLGYGYSTMDALPFGLVDPNSGSFGPFDASTYEVVTRNPLNLAAVVNSFGYSHRGGDDYFVNNTGFFKHDRTGAWNVLYCNSTVNDVNYRYKPALNGVGGSYQIISSTMSSSRMSYLVAIGTHMGVMRKILPSRIEGAGLRGGSYTITFAQELSRELIGLTAAMYEPIPVTAIKRTSVVLGSRIQLVPLALYLAAVVIYAFMTLVIGITALIEAHCVNFVSLARLRIISSLPIVHALFGPVDSSRTWKNDGVEMFSTESEKDRLYIGPTAPSRSLSRLATMSYTYPHFASQSPAASYQSAHTITQYMEQRLGHSTHVVEDDEEAQISPSTSPSRHPRRMSYGSLPRRRSSGHLTDGRGRRMSYGTLQAPDETAPLLSTPLNAATAFDTAFAGPLVDAVIDESDEESDTETEGRTGGPKSQPHSTGATLAALGKEGKIIISYSVPVLITQLLEYSLSIASVISIGHLSTVELAASTLGSMTASVTGWSVIIGMISALDTLLPQAWGGAPERRYLVGLWSQRMTVVIAIILVPILIIWQSSHAILLFLRQDEDVAYFASIYLKWLSIG
ncbi:hypothetical protein FRC00_000074, partial [Tulasnella sp. 408]